MNLNKSIKSFIYNPKSLLPLVFLFGLFSNGQNISGSDIEVKYHCHKMQDTLVPNFKKKGYMTLYIKGDESLYKSEAKFIRDSINHLTLMKRIPGQVVNFPKMPRPYTSDEVYREGDHVKMFMNLVTYYYTFEPPKKLDWQLQEGHKKIGPYICQKAQTKYGDRLVTAWYTAEIPIPDGPYTFKGLPGLILEVYDKNHYFDFKMVSIKKSNRDISPVNWNVINTDYEKFVKKRKEFYDDPYAYGRQRGYKISKEREETRKKQYARLNNHLD